MKITPKRIIIVVAVLILICIHLGRMDYEKRWTPNRLISPSGKMDPETKMLIQTMPVANMRL